MLEHIGFKARTAGAKDKHKRKQRASSNKPSKDVLHAVYEKYTGYLKQGMSDKDARSAALDDIIGKKSNPLDTIGTSLDWYEKYRAFWERVEKEKKKVKG